jgi:hypothetical protein
MYIYIYTYVNQGTGSYGKINTIGRKKARSAMDIEKVLPKDTELHVANVKSLSDLPKKDNRIKKQQVEPIDAPTRISGPTLLYQFNNVMGKRILLIGESHNMKSLCSETPKNYVEIHHWLDNLLSHTTECIDVFLEMPYRRFSIRKRMVPLKSYIDGESPYHAVKDTISHCIEDPTCYGGNIRVHYVDLRFFSEPDFYSYVGVTKLLLVHTFKNISFDTKDNICRYLVGINPTYEDEFITFINKIQDEHPEVISLKFENKNVDRQTIIKFYMDYNSRASKAIIKEMSKLPASIDKNKFISTLIGIYDELNISGHGFDMIQMDAYFLARLFMEYDTKKLPRGPQKCPNMNKNCIFYGGAFHAMVYRRFFEKFFGSSINILKNKRPEEDCVTFMMPFNYWMGK